jgi:DNA mismatch repair protein MutS
MTPSLTPGPGPLTPLLLQYRKIKDKYRDAILLFRLGDFYEMFYDDAATGARVLGLTLTSRSHGAATKVPLAGVPAKAIDTYIAKLVEAGYRVAVCEQLEVPGLTKLIRRDVVEVITPGTSLRPTLLPERRNQFLVGICPSSNPVSRVRSPCPPEDGPRPRVAERGLAPGLELPVGFAYADVSTGEFGLTELRPSALVEEVQKLDPREIIHPKGWDGAQKLSLPNVSLTPLDDYYFSRDFAHEKLTRHFHVANLEGFGITDQTAGIQAAGAVLAYLEESQKSALSHIRKVSLYRTADYLLTDRVSRRNLELVERMRDGSGEGTLLAVLDRTQTPAGARLLRRWLLMPLLEVPAISERQQAIGDLLKQHVLQAGLRSTLNEVGDLERVASRIACERANARDCVGLKDWLLKVPQVKTALERTRSPRLKQLHDQIEDYAPIADRLATTLVAEPPLAISEGGMIRDGVNDELNQLRNLSRNAKEWIALLQETERKRTGIPNLKVGYNSVFGYYIEVTRSYLNQAPKSYLRKQTVANGERFITPELKEYESKVLHSEERMKSLEYEIFVALRQEIAREVGRLLNLSQVLAELDVLVSLSLVALENSYICPVVDESSDLIIRDGRHPVVERLMPEAFVPNDTEMGVNPQILLITGPNMAGKSTYLRQVALIVIMAQMGSYVPAREAKIGVCDKIFTRIGASDDVSRGVSTFLAEMTETANILNNATRHSLVVLDEVGRGTATFDGLAIAWAVVEYLHQNPTVRPKTLFATHYHELTDIVQYLPRVRNYNFLVKEAHDDIVFLRRLVSGRSDRSYGIAVGKLAGLPPEVVSRAKQVLADFEQGERVSVRAVGQVPTVQDGDSCGVALNGDTTRSGIPLNALGSEQAAQPQLEAIVSELEALDLNSLTPLRAMNLLAEWQKKLTGKP